MCECYGSSEMNEEIFFYTKRKWNIFLKLFLLYISTDIATVSVVSAAFLAITIYILIFGPITIVKKAMPLRNQK